MKIIQNRNKALMIYMTYFLKQTYHDKKEHMELI
jgi:hypothetical protein